MLGKYFTICSIYLSPSLTVNERDLVRVLDQLPKPYLLLGDMNARHPRWGEPVTNEKGSLVERLLINQDISLINEIDKTHYSIQHGTETLIDLSIASSDCQLDFAYSISENLHGSDHYPIKLCRTIYCYAKESHCSSH